MDDKSLKLSAVAAALIGRSSHGMRLHPYNPVYIYKESKRKDRANAKRLLSTKERVEARKNRAKPKA